MVKKHYGKPSARRACNAIKSKLRYLHEDDYISSKLYIQLTDSILRIKKGIK